MSNDDISTLIHRELVRVGASRETPDHGDLTVKEVGDGTVRFHDMYSDPLYTDGPAALNRLREVEDDAGLEAAWNAVLSSEEEATR